MRWALRVVLFETIAPRFSDRPGGYTRILRLAKPRLGDAGTRAVLEFVGVHDRVVQKSEKPAFEDDSDLEDSPQTEAVAATQEAAEEQDEAVSQEPAAEATSAEEQESEDDAKKDESQ